MTRVLTGRGSPQRAEIIGINATAQAAWPDKRWHGARARGALLGHVIRRQPPGIGPAYVIDATGQWWATLQALEGWLDTQKTKS